MEDYKKAIARYEVARQKVADLTEKKRTLVSDCDNLKEREGEDWTHTIHRKACLAVAWDFMQQENADGDIYGRLTYEDALYGDDIGTISGGVCDKCLEAYSIKRGELAEVKREFGAAKRSLSVIGKSLIKRG